MIGLKRTVEPLAEPISVDELKTHCKIEVTAEDASELPILIAAARIDCENYLSAAFITQTWQWALDSFRMPPWHQGHFYSGPLGLGLAWDNAVQNGDAASPSATYGDLLVLPRPPLKTLSSIAYTDLAGAGQTLGSGSYQLDAISRPARLAPAYGTIWPLTRPQLNAVVIQMINGYGDAGSSVPANIRMAVLLAAGFYFYNRDKMGDLPNCSRRLLDLEWEGNVR